MFKPGKFLAVFFALFFAVSSAGAAGTVRTVEHVSDGDTLVLDNGEKVRLIGVDTPEIHDRERNLKNASRFHLNPKKVEEYSQKAKNYARAAVEGKKVRLEFDKEPKDRFGRRLAYVYRVSDDLFLNEHLIREGYGFAYLRFPFRYSAEFGRSQKEAQARHKGIWSGS